MRKIKKYFNYLKYILEHKKNVFIECWKEGLYIEAFIHDLSKFHPVEFISYADKFYGNKDEKENNKFEYGWLHHKHCNKHHWNYWIGDNNVPLDMPVRYIKEMICDWKAMGKKFGDTAQSFYKNNRHKMNLSINTRIRVEYTLGFIDGPSVMSNITWDDYLKKLNISEDEDFKKTKPPLGE